MARGPRNFDRGLCHFCGGPITFHEEDPEHPWKHDFTEDSLRCAKDKPAGEKTGPVRAEPASEASATTHSHAPQDDA